MKNRNVKNKKQESGFNYKRFNVRQTNLTQLTSVFKNVLTDDYKTEITNS